MFRKITLITGAIVLVFAACKTKKSTQTTVTGHKENDPIVTLDTISVAHEIFDLNSGKIIEQTKQVRSVLNQKKLKPFQFACNKN